MDGPLCDGRNWSEILEETRIQLQAEDDPYLLWRFEELCELRGTLLDYVEAIEASLLSFRQGKDTFEAAFGDTTLIRTVHLLTSLQTVPGRVSDYLSGDEAGET